MSLVTMSEYQNFLVKNARGSPQPDTIISGAFFFGYFIPDKKGKSVDSSNLINSLRVPATGKRSMAALTKSLPLPDA
jgi:hypothetical protein